MTSRRDILLAGAKTAGLLGAYGLTTGFSTQAMPKSFIPGHVESNDPTWDMLNTLQFLPARAGVQEAQFSPAIRRLSGTNFTVRGFLLQLDPRPRFSHFVVTRRNSSCPFCPPNEMGEAVEIFTPRPLGYTPNEYQVSGKLELFTNPASGLYYRLTQATVTRA